MIPTTIQEGKIQLLLLVLNKEDNHKNRADLKLHYDCFLARNTMAANTALILFVRALVEERGHHFRAAIKEFLAFNRQIGRGVAEELTEDAHHYFQGDYYYIVRGLFAGQSMKEAHAVFVNDLQAFLDPKTEERSIKDTQEQVDKPNAASTGSMPVSSFIPHKKEGDLGQEAAVTDTITVDPNIIVNNLYIGKQPDGLSRVFVNASDRRDERKWFWKNLSFAQKSVFVCLMALLVGLFMLIMGTVPFFAANGWRQFIALIVYIGIIKFCIVDPVLRFWRKLQSWSTRHPSNAQQVHRQAKQGVLFKTMLSSTTPPCSSQLQASEKATRSQSVPVSGSKKNMVR